MHGDDEASTTTTTTTAAMAMARQRVVDTKCIGSLRGEMLFYINPQAKILQITTDNDNVRGMRSGVDSLFIGCERVYSVSSYGWHISFSLFNIVTSSGGPRPRESDVKDDAWLAALAQLASAFWGTLCSGQYTQILPVLSHSLLSSGRFSSVTRDTHQTLFGWCEKNNCWDVTDQYQSLNVHWFFFFGLLKPISTVQLKLNVYIKTVN